MDSTPKTPTDGLAILAAGTASSGFLDLSVTRSGSSIAALVQQPTAAHLPEIVEKVRSGFAFAVGGLDGSRLLAVDPFGIDQICYRVHGQDVVVGPRADDVAGLDAELDAQALYDYLYFHVIPSPRTIFKGVQRLPAGHQATVRHGKVEARAYWVPDFAAARRSPSSLGALREEFLSTLEAAVAAQLDGTKPACFLSGGTDSSTVAGMATKVAGKVASYSIGFEAEGYDEMAFARIAAKHFGTDHHEYYVTPDDLVRSIPDVAAHYDQPFGNSSAVPAYYCAKMAREDGVTKLLAGDGGDELFSGNTRYAKQKVFGVYDAVPALLRSALLEPLFDNRLVATLPGLGKVSSYIRQARVPMPDRMHTYNLLERLGVETVLTPAFLRLVDRQGPATQQRAVWAQLGNAGLLDKQLAYDWRYTLAECDLPKVVGTSQLAGVAVGFPMLDHRLVDFSMRLPNSYKLRGLKLRWFFKEALRGFLPDEIITKKKQGFGLPFGVWATKHARLKALARDSLEGLTTRGFVNPAFIRQLLDVKLAEHPGYYGEMVWILMMLEQWLRRHAPTYSVRS